MEAASSPQHPLTEQTPRRQVRCRHRVDGRWGSAPSTEHGEGRVSSRGAGPPGLPFGLPPQEVPTRPGLPRAPSLVPQGQVAREGSLSVVWAWKMASGGVGA